MIEFLNVTKRFENASAPALDDVTLHVDCGETMVLLGSSGSGKTTALKVINRLIEPTSGEVRIAGRPAAGYDVFALRRSMGYVFQGIGLFPNLTVRQNVGVVPGLSGWSRERTQDRAEELLDLVGLPGAEFGDRYPEQLSGGQAQRVGVARGLAADPDYLLMDEPFGALDAVTRSRLQSELLELQARLGKTIVFVTHDLFEAVKLGDRIAVLHEGKLQQVGSSRELYHSPRTPFVRELFQQLEEQVGEVSRLMDAAP